MTCQVMLANFNGVAVASDTATTNTRSNAVSLGNHKIFELGGAHRVLVALAASAWQDGQPQSQTLLQWRNSLREPLLRLEDYVQSFNAWHSSGVIGSNDQQSSDNLKWCIIDHFKFLNRRVGESGVFDVAGDDWLPGMVESTIEQTVTEIFEEGLEWLRGLPNYPSIDDDVVIGLLERYEVNVDYLIFNELSRLELTDRQIEILKESVPLTISRAQYIPAGSTDLHFIGYGLEDSAPGIIELSNRGTIGDLPMQLVLPQLRIGADAKGSTSLVKFAAQDSAIDAFFTGIEVNMMQRVKSSFDAEMQNTLGSKMGIVDFEDAWDKVEDRIQFLQRRHFVTPFHEVVGSAPVDRLAELASTLVELQKIRSETDPGVNSVGGDVDVAVITADRGVEWVRGRATN